MFRKKELISTASDLTTSGVVNWMLTYIPSLPDGVMNTMTIALPALGCGSNLILRLNNEKILEKDKQKILKFKEELQSSMERQHIDDLKYFINLDFPVEIYSVIEEIIREAINAKGEWLRKFASNIVVTIGSNDAPNLMQGKRLCLSLLKELNETDIKMLFLYEAIRKANYEKNISEESINQMYQDLKTELLYDTSVYAQTIFTSSNKLRNLGLVRNSCSLSPYDEKQGNKKDMIEDFLSKNRENATAHYKELQRYLYTLVG